MPLRGHDGDSGEHAQGNVLLAQSHKWLGHLECAGHNLTPLQIVLLIILSPQGGEGGGTCGVIILSNFYLNIPHLFDCVLKFVYK